METHVTKLVVVATQNEQQAAQLIREMPNHSTEVVTVGTPSGAQRWISSPDVAAWVLDESLGVLESRRLLSVLSLHRPETPRVYIATKTENIPFIAQGPDAVIEKPLRPRALLEQLDKLLGASAFTRPLVDACTVVLKDIVASAFIPKADIRSIRLKAVRIPAHEVNASIPFCGDVISGRLDVGASSPTLRRIHARLLPTHANPSPLDLEDLLGEMCNQILGSLRRAAARGGIRFSVGVPMMFTAHTCPVRYAGRRGSVAWTTGALGQELVVDLSIDKFRTRFRGGRAANDVVPGKVSYL